MRRSRVTIAGLLQAAAVVTVVFSLVTAMPVDFFGIQLFAHFRLQYLVVGLLLLAALSAMRCPWYAAALVAVTALNASLVVPWYIGDTHSGGDTRVTIVQANILSSNTDHGRLFEFLDEEQPDIVILQEVSSQWLVALDRLRTDYPWSYAESREGKFGIALFSRLPLRSASHIDSPPLGFPTIIAAVDVGDEALALVASHPMIPITGQLYKARNGQLASLVELLAGFTDEKVLVGDLNTSMWDASYREFEEDTGMRNTRRGFGVVPTWPTFLPFAMIPIDHVLVSSAIGVESVRKGPRIGSDHLPLVVTITL